MGAKEQDKVVELESGSAKRIKRRNLRRAQLSLPERAAEAALRDRPGGWKVQRRAGESFKYALFVLERRLPPQKLTAAGWAHTLAVSPGVGLLAFGLRMLGVLGVMDGPDNLVLDDDAMIP